MMRMAPSATSRAVEPSRAREINAEWGFTSKWPRVQAVDGALRFSRADVIFRPATVDQRPSATWV